MSQKVIRILISAAAGLLTLVILVGFTYVYDTIVYTNPLESSLNGSASIGSFTIEQLQERARIKIEFAQAQKLRSNFYLLLDNLEGQKFKAAEQITIEITNEEDELLKQFLTQARLPVFEAISTGKFSEMPANLEKIKEEIPVEYDLEIDNNFVFVTVFSGDKFAHMVINRGSSPLVVVNTMGGDYL